MVEQPLASYEALIETFPPARPFASRLMREAGPLPRMIAELKRRSPSAGLLREPYAPRQLAIGYARAGAAAISVLTEPAAFGGDVAHLVEARPAHLPLLRKDFLVTRWQIAESRVAGADAVLLIAALLPGGGGGGTLGAMLAAARQYGVEALVEVHDEEELARALDAGATVIGVNNRDLKTLAVDLATCERLAPKIPSGVLAVAESGIASRRDIDRLLGCGYGAFLVGEALMRSHDPGDALWRLTREES
jgi:indole-3-glycerol phosphate synthase